MPLCSICRSIPYRKVIQGHESLYDLTYNNGSIYRVRSYNSFTELFSSGLSCELCCIVSRSIQTSVSYQGYLSDEDKCQPVWLCLRFGGSPAGEIQVYVGSNEPETMVFGKKLRILTTLDDPMAKSITNRCVQQDPTHPLALKQIELWLGQCAHEHDQCSVIGQDPMKLPTRVLDLNQLPKKDSMDTINSLRDRFTEGKCKLVESGTHYKGQYVALSYCWGKTLAFKTTTGNLQSHKDGFNFSLLPRTLQDAILMTRYLNLRYIWIDCLCIIQDDKADWEREAALMADVYSNAFLTIAAARASDSQEGFLGDRKTMPMDPVQFEDELGSYCLYFYDYDISAGPGAAATVVLDPLVSEPLSKRVWTLQERVLAPRTLHFGTEQTFWECNEAWKCEDGLDLDNHENTGFRLDHIVKGLQSQAPLYRKDNLRRLWHILVESYTSRNMTYQSDKLPALSGMIDALQRQTNDKCYAGIWRSHFLEGLNWQVIDHDIYLAISKQPQRPSTWRAPSWSFAAIEGLVSYEGASIDGNRFTELEECNLTPAGLNPLGELRDGFVRLRGPIVDIERTSETQDSNDLYQLQLHGRNSVRVMVDFDFERLAHCSAVILSSNAGLALRALGRDGYVRVGRIRVLNKRSPSTGSWYSSGDDLILASNLPPPSSVTLL